MSLIGNETRRYSGGTSDESVFCVTDGLNLLMVVSRSIISKLAELNRCLGACDNLRRNKIFIASGLNKQLETTSAENVQAYFKYEENR